jgi:hypothetical protein
MLVTISYVSRLAVVSGCAAQHPNTIRRSLQQLCQVHRALLKEKLRDVKMDIDHIRFSIKPLGKIISGAHLSLFVIEMRTEQCYP